MLARAGLRRIAAGVVVAAAVASASAADRIAYQGRLVMGTRGIVVMDASGDNPVELPHPPGSDCITPALKPDGTAIAYAAKAGDQYKLWTAPLGPDNSLAGEPTQLTTGVSDDEQPAWSPDGRRIAYVSVSGDQRSLAVIPVEGGPPTQLTALGSDFRNACPHWSPDGASIVFGSDGKLLILDLAAGPGAPARELASGGMYPSWSPDGDHIAFFARKPGQGAELVETSLATGATRTLAARIEFFGETAWSPDGKSVAFKADRVADAEGSLWVVPAAGGQVKPLRSYGVAHGYLDWARGPETVVAAAAPAPPSGAKRPGKSAPSVTVAAPKPAAAAAPVKPVPGAKAGAAVKLPEAPPQPAPVRIISPVEDAAVRGIARVTVTKSEPGGYVSFFVDGKFVSATIAPYEMTWDTRPAGEGPHTISVIGYGSAGDEQGRAEAQVEVRNAISAETVPQEGMLLRYRFKAKEKWEYDISVQAQAGGKKEIALPGVEAQGGTLQADVVQRVESVKQLPAAGEREQVQMATLITQIRQGSLRAPGSSGALPQVGQAARCTRTTIGRVETIASSEGSPPISLGNLGLEFPPQPVKVGDRWAAPMTVLPVLRSTAVARVTAEHKLEGLQWEQGYETVRIVSTFTTAALAVGVEGMALRDVSGTRTTWFAYKEHFVVRMHDELSGIFRQREAPALAGTPAYARPGAGPSALLHYTLSLTQALHR